MAFKHGITLTEISDGARTLTAVSTSIIGLVATGADADATTFPLDTPALVTDIETAIGKAGTDGTLATSLRAIADQTRAVVVVVRVEEGADDAGTASNVIGTTMPEGKKTGMQALLDAKSQLGVKPKILGTPGLETQAVTTALVAVAKKLRGFGYARVIGDTVADAALYRANFSAREVMLLMPDFLLFDTATSTNVTGYAAAYAMGLRALIDTQTGPHKTLSNIAVSGVVGVSQPIRWDIEDDTSEANLLNASEVTALVRTDDGFRFWGNRTCSDDPLFLFENYTRTAQVIADTMAEGHMWAVDKPITPVLIRDIVDGIKAKFRELKTAGYIVDADCWFDETANDKESLKAGKLYLDYDYTPVPPLENLTLRQRITDKYLVNLIASING